MTVTVDEDGLKERIEALKIRSADYRDLRMVDDKIFYTRRTVGDEGADDEDGAKVKKGSTAVVALNTAYLAKFPG